MVAVLAGGAADLRAEGSVAGDRAALTALYNATDGPNWTDDTNWLSDRPLAQWHGVSVDNAGRVTNIVLGSNNLSGAIPPELGDLTELYWLDLSYNDLSGAVPAELSRLSRLWSLGLHFNPELDGALPDSLRELSRLQRLFVRGTGLCAPRDSAFQAWLAGVNFIGPTCPPEPTTIDVAVFYTPAARTQRGGAAQIEAAVDLWLAGTNRAFADSGVYVELRLVVLEEVSYTETGSTGTDRRRLQSPSDGHMDEVHDVIDRVGADLTVGVIYPAAGTKCRGNAEILRGYNSDKARAFAVVGATCRFADLFAHEVGHLLGAHHDRYENGPQPWSGYSYGYVNQRTFAEGADASSRWRTIMAYGTQCRDAGFYCTRLLRFSNPDQTHLGDPLGVPGEQPTTNGPDGPANAVRGMNGLREHVASFRDAPLLVSLSPPEATVNEGESTTLTVRLSAGPEGSVTIPLVTTPEGGAQVTDYSGVPASLTFASGQTEATVEFLAVDDREDDDGESVVLGIGGDLPEGVSAGSPATATVTIQDNDADLAPPVVSIVPVATPVAEGERAAFRVTRTGPATKSLRVNVTWSSSDRSDVLSTSLLFHPDRRTKEPYRKQGDDAVVREDVTVTLTLEDGEGYAVSPEARSATVVLEDNDEAEFTLSVEPAEVTEGESATVRAEITNGVTFEEDQPVTLDFAGSTATQGADYRVSPQSLTLRAGASAATATVTALDDGENEGDETVAIAARHGGKQIGAGTLTIADPRTAPLTARFVGMPRAHDGERAFRFELHFSEEFRISFRTLRDSAFRIQGGSVREARRLARPSNLRWEITVKPASAADVVVLLPATADCAATGAICAEDGRRLSSRLEATVRGPASQLSGQGFSLAPGNGRPSGLWSDGATAWVADLEDARLYAYRQEDGERQPDRDIATGPAPMGLWSDGETLWVAGLGGGVRAHGLADGTRRASRDLALEAIAAPAGIWSDGETVWVSEWLGDTVHAYRLADGERLASRDIGLAGENLMPVGLWSDGETLWVADWSEWVYAYRLADGRRDPARDLVAGTADTDPTGLWSGGGTLLATGWEDGEVRAYELPEAVSPAGGDRTGSRAAPAVSLPPVADPALAAAIGAALGKGPGASVSEEELAGLEALEARDTGIRDLTGLEGATSLKVLDLGFNPLGDLRPLTALPELEDLNLDGAAPDDLRALAALTGLKRLSLRHNGIGDLGVLAGLTQLEELDAGDNRITDLWPLARLPQLKALRVDRNEIADLSPVAWLVRLELLELGTNRVADLRPLAGLARLRTLDLAGNGFAALDPLSGLAALEELGLARNAVEALHPLSALSGLRRLDLRGNPVGDLGPLWSLRSLAWVHVGGTGIEDLAPLHALEGVTVAGRDDLQPPEAAGGTAGRTGRNRAVHF